MAGDKSIRVIIVYNDTADSVGRREAYVDTLVRWGDFISGIDATTQKAFAIPVSRIVRIDGERDSVQQAMERIYSGGAMIEKVA